VKRSFKNYVLLILGVTLFTLAFFLFPQVRELSAKVLAGLRALDTALSWVLWTILGVMTLLMAAAWVLLLWFKAKLAREKIRLGIGGERLKVPEAEKPPTIGPGAEAQ
jgi:hypothetical protein